VLWDFGNGSYSNEKANSFSYRYPLAGTYKPILNIINEFGCENKFDSLTIDVSTKPKANFYLDPEKVDLLNPTIYFNDLSSKDVVSWQWLINGKLHSTEINTERTFKDTGIVSIVLIVENKNGCLDTAYSQATVKDVERIWIPNAFTPNSDGINDAFFPVGNVIFDGNFELKIYDRFGAEIFSSNSIDKKWNGAFQNEGEILPFGVYVYQLNYFDEARHLKTLKGHLTLQK
jgi:gliding motility-associated-like protein